MKNELWDYCVSLANRAFSKSYFYKNVFNGSKDANDVLADLANFCGAYDIDLRRNKDGDLTALDMARRAGKLEVFQYIAKILSMTESQKINLATRYFDMQSKQQQEIK